MAYVIYAVENHDSYLLIHSESVRLGIKSYGTLESGAHAFHYRAHPRPNLQFAD